MAPSLTDQIAETAKFTAVHAGLVSEDEASLAWLVTGAVLMVQQACVLSLSEAGAELPLMPGPGELVARVSDPAVLEQPYTAPMKSGDHRAFERVVAARNDVMHPKPAGLAVDAAVLPDGLIVAAKLVRHLVLTQPVRPSSVTPAAATALDNALKQVETGVEFWRTVLARP